MHEACISKNYEGAKYLLEVCHANPSIRNDYGLRPRDIIRDSPKFLALFDNYYKEHDIAVEATQIAQSRPTNDTSNHMGADDLNISCTYRERAKSSRAPKVRSTLGENKKVVLFRTSMTETEKAQLGLLAEKLRIQVVKDMGNNGWIHNLFPKFLF